VIRALPLLIALLAPGATHAQQAWAASYPEGPVWIDETLYWAEMTADEVKTWTGGEPEVAFKRKGCGPTAIARYRQTGFLVLCHLEGAVVWLDADMRLVSVIRATADGIRLRDPNDASADGAGGVWFTDPGRFSRQAPAEGAVYYLSPDGELTRHVTGLAYGNGVHVDRAAGQLLVSEHLARQVLSYPITADGLGAPEVLFRLDDFKLNKPRYPEAGPDGLEIGPDGTLWVAEYGAKRILGWRQDMGLVAAMVVDAPFVTNIAFGPGGLAALTGAKDNRVFPYPGAVWVFKADILSSMRIK